MARIRSYCYREVLPFVAIVAAECTTIGSSTVFKAAVSEGLSFHIFMLYSYAIASVVLFPLSRIFHRKAQLPPLTKGIIFKFFVLGALGYIGQYLGNLGIAWSSPTLGSVMSNLTPASTFILALFFGMEKLELRSWSSQAKIFGTLLTIAGACVAVLYNGPAIINRHAQESRPASASLLHRTSVESNWVMGGGANWVMGGGALTLQYIIASIWYTFEATVLGEYPAEMVIIFFYNFSCTIFSLIDCVINERRDLDAWKVKPDIQLVSILYTGTIGTSLSILIHTWGVHVKGPFYVALFLPLTITIAAIMGVIFLGDTLYLGCIIGSVIISVGFYSVVWGKSREERDDQYQGYNDVESSINSAAPLLKDPTGPQ